MKQQKKKMSEFGGQGRPLFDLRSVMSKCFNHTQMKEPRVPGQPGSASHTRTEGTTMKLCGDSNVGEQGTNGHYALGRARSSILACAEFRKHSTHGEKGRLRTQCLLAY